MGVRRIYFCCLCRRDLEQSALIPIAWKGDCFEKAAIPHQYDRHLCLQCIESAHAIHQKLVSDLQEPVH